MKLLLLAAALAMSASAQASAGGHTDKIPKASFEVRRLGYYIGAWEGRGETKAGPFGKAGKLSSRMVCSWFAGGFQVICKGEETGPSGRREFLNILAYDARAKGYTEYSVSSLGESEYDQRGSLVGHKLTFLVDQEVEGKPAKFRYTEMHVSPPAMTYEAEISLDGGPWTGLAAGKIVKMK
jgi:hypothetical protein